MRLSYPTRRPGPSIYQSDVDASLVDWRSPPAFVGLLRYDRMVFVVGLDGSGAGEALRLRPKGEERKRAVREGWAVALGLGFKELLVLSC